jgi:hypothetical protein
MAQALPLLLNLAVGTTAYGIGYFATPIGRADLAMLMCKVRSRPVY